MILICKSTRAFFLAFEFLLSQKLRAGMLCLLIASAIAGAMFPSQSWGQAISGAVSGTIKDSQGAVLPDATAVLTNTKTGVSQTVHTNSSGLYHEQNLQPGTYDLIVSIPGFTNGATKGIVVDVGAAITVDFTLNIASASETITVTGVESSVDLQTSTISYGVVGTTVRELPLNGRDFTSLATLNPSVSTLNGEAGSSGSARSGRGKALTISGNRPAANNFLFDGISMNDQSNNTPGSILGVTLGVDAIDQFTLFADTFPAEYGNASGGILNAVTRSGTNTIHGSAFYFGRNSAIDALNYFDVTSLPDPAFRRHQYGASAGGPIKKDKMFWFGDFEAISQVQGLTNLIRVPTLNSWANAAPEVRKFQSVYPTTTALQDASATCQANTNSTACYDQIPIVNTSVGNEDYWLGKFDWKLNEKNAFQGSYFGDTADLKSPDSFNNQITDTKTKRAGVAINYTRILTPSLVNVARVGYSRNLDQGALPSTTKVLNPALSQVGYGYDFVPGKGIGGISVTNLTGVTANPLATDFNKAAYNSYQEYDSLVWTKGTHSFKFGGNVNRMQYNSIGTNLQGGSFTVTSALSTFLQDGVTNANNPSSGGGALQGTYGSTLNYYAYPATTAGSPVYHGTYNDNLRAYRQTLIGMFAQDDWKILSNLTVNYGVRYEFVTIPTEADHRTAILTHLTDTAPTVGGPLALGNPSLKGVSPRLGFTYDPFKKGKTAIRAGAGLYDSLDLLNEYDLVFERSFPYNTQESLATASGINLNGTFPSLAYCLGAQQNTALGYVDPAFNAGGNCANLPASATRSGLSLRTAYIDPNPPRSYIAEWNLNVEQQFGAWGVTVSYVGSRGIHLLQVERNINTVMPTITSDGRYFYPAVLKTQGLKKLNPLFASINCSATFNADSIYDAMHVAVKRNLTKGLQVIGSYAWGKSIDTSSSTSSTSSGTGYAYAIGNPQPLLPKINRGRSDFDIKNSATMSVVYDLPKNHLSFKPASILLSGWEVTAIYKVQSGTPFTITLTGDEVPLNSSLYYGISETDTTGATVGERPNVVAGCKVTNPGNIAHYVNTACFTYPNNNDSYNGAPGVFLGNEQRNSLSAPGYQDVDTAFIRNDKFFHERLTGQFRLELFNALNHPNFGAPATTSGMTVTGPSSSFTGQITSTAGNIPRQIQYGYKLIF